VSPSVPRRAPRPPSRASRASRPWRSRICLNTLPMPGRSRSRSAAAASRSRRRIRAASRGSIASSSIDRSSPAPGRPSSRLSPPCDLRPARGAADATRRVGRSAHARSRAAGAPSCRRAHVRGARRTEGLRLVGRSRSRRLARRDPADGLPAHRAVRRAFDRRGARRRAPAGGGARDARGCGHPHRPIDRDHRPGPLGEGLLQHQGRLRVPAPARPRGDGDLPDGPRRAQPRPLGRPAVPGSHPGRHHPAGGMRWPRDHLVGHVSPRTDATAAAAGTETTGRPASGPLRRT